MPQSPVNLVMNTESTNNRKVVVVGGSGLIGKKLVGLLQTRGYDVVSASRATGVNVLAGEGLAEAFRGASVVVDVLNSPSFEDAAVLEFFETSTRNLLAAEAVAGVQHHIALSVVGTDRLQASGYFRAKLVQERLIEDSPVPFTIVRATQFFEFAAGIAYAATRDRVVSLSTALMQPVAADDVVEALADLVGEKAVQGTVEIAGPEKLRQDDFVGRLLAATGDNRKVVANPDAGYFGTPVTDSSLVAADGARLGTIKYADWLAKGATAQ
jgi:uncharacterized protein YbjT (DUF2867 family)